MNLDPTGGVVDRPLADLPRHDTTTPSPREETP
jgi:hypothetical protein